ncbi:MAG: competence/damage-inducible protein A, partial [Candidatus Eremiobacteraeota bacterium]|nr:competence/damage-inducible protein A [Candidatus Eremiobacteraeota bacterium]
DNRERLEAMLRLALERADGVVTTGGLGPTVDDLTKEAVADATGTELALHQASLEAIEARFAAMGRTMSENNRRQAMLPTPGIVLENPHGTAPGFVALRADGKFVAGMPGVPREMRAMLTERLIPWLVERFGLRGTIATRTIHTIGIPESELDRRIEDLFRSLENPKIAVLAHGGRCDVKIMAKAETTEAARELIAPVEQEIRERIGYGIFGVDDQTIEGAIVDALRRRRQTIATAESCTGGAVADALVRVPGASAVFRGGVVAYSDDAKRDLLDVPLDVLREHGAVSVEAAIAMARGARRRLGTDIAIATTGVAGPTGGTEEKPVGLVWFALVTDAPEPRTYRANFPGERSDIRSRATMAALSAIWRYLERADAQVPITPFMAAAPR